MLESVQRLAQKYVAQFPTLVVGSGASMPFGLPSMPDLAAAVLADDRLQPYHVTPAWAAFAEALAADMGFEGALDEANFAREALEQIATVVWDVVSVKDREVHQEVASGALRLSLSRLLAHLLRVATPRVQIVTTNYDRLIEYASDVEQAHVFTGFSPGWVQFRQEAIWSSNRRQVHLWKVHGSLDWFRRADQIEVGLPLAPAIPPGMTPIVVTPGVQKYEQAHQEPFRSIISNADRALREAAAIMCIGYGFNDPHVQPKLIERVRVHRAPIIVLARTLTAAAKSNLLSPPCEKFLLLEEDPEGTRAFLPEQPGGVVIEGKNLWELEHFMAELIEANDK